MKKFALVLSLALLIVIASSYVPRVSAAPLFEDPQVCLNGKLLMVEPTTEPIEVWVSIGPDVAVDFDVVNCGGDPDLPVLEADHLLTTGVGDRFVVAVQTVPHASVKFDWNGHSITKNSGRDGWVFYSRRAR